MSALEPYLVYREEEQQTFSRIPDHWDCVRVRHLARIRTGSGDTVDAQPDGDFPFYVRSDKPLLSDKWEFDTTAVLTAGDGAGVAKVFHLVSGRFMAHQRVYVLDDFRRVIPQFFYYAFSNLFHLMALDGSAKSTVDSVRRPMIADMPIAVPPLEEQGAIAAYLDRETARIGMLIAEQQRLIEMLRERREAMITSGVTRGLNPNVELVPSGELSLGEIPAHWTVQRIKNVGRAVIGLTYGPEDVRSGPDEGTLVLRAGNIQGGGLRLENNVYVSCAIPDALRLRSGDIVICARNGSANLIGKNAVVTDEVVGQTWGAFMAVLRSELNGYLRWVLNSQVFKTQTGFFSTSTINQLTSATLHNLRFALPPIDEQRSISAHLNEQTVKTDILIAEAERFIELSKERRSALITAAVTGQVNVREAG